MSVPDISAITPLGSIHDISPQHQASPYTAYWWASNYATLIPESSVAWMLAQGWQIISVSYDNSTTPATPYYNMGRQSMQNWMILQSLMNSMTSAYNEAREHNDQRYEDVLTLWNETITKSQTHYDTMGDGKNAHTVLFLANMATWHDSLQAHITTARTSITTNTNTVTTQLSAFLTKLDEIETNYNTQAAAIETILDTKAANLTTFLAAHEASLDELESEFNTHLTAIRTLETTANTNSDAHIATFQAQLDLLPTEYTSHKTTAEAFLTGLGTTELARINERFDNLLTTAEQKLTDRGLYSSALVTQAETRIERERDEAIAALNDRLNREKLDNEHKLYEQLSAMRERTRQGLGLIYQVRDTLSQWKAQNESRLQSEIMPMRLQVAQGIEHRHTAQQSVSREEAAQRDALYAQLVTAVGHVLTGKQQYASATLQNANALVDNYVKLGAQQMMNDLKYLENWAGLHDGEMKLMQYQVDERNKLMTLLFGFMERRSDEGPSMESLTNLASQLGDAGRGMP